MLRHAPGRAGACEVSQCTSYVTRQVVAVALPMGAQTAFLTTFAFASKRCSREDASARGGGV